MNNINTKSITRTVLIGLSIFMLSFASYTAIKGNLFIKGPSIVVANENDYGGSDDNGNGSNGGGDNQSCCDSNVDNNQNSDNGSNQNNSNDNPDNTAYNPSPVPSPVPSPIPSPIPSPVVSPSPVPSPSVIPSPSPVVSPSPSPLNMVQCPVGHIAQIVNSTVVCVSQNQQQQQQQNNHQQQNNNNEQKLNVTVNPTITNTNNNNVTIPAQVAGVTVVKQTSTSIKELPKTGLPLAAVGIAGMLPFGSRLRKLGKKNTEEETANSIWMQRQLGQ